MNCYWPAEGSIKIGIWIIELLNTSTYNEYILRKLKLTNSEVLVLFRLIGFHLLVVSVVN